MKNQYSLKKQLNNTLYKKKLEINSYGIGINNLTESIANYDKIKFTKALLKNKTLINVLKTTNLNFPLNFLFFNTFNSYKIFYKKYFNYINILKIKNKILKTYFLNPNFFSQNQTNFFFFFN